MLNYKTTKDIKLSEKLIDQVIGQDEAINIVKKAAKQKRHVLLIGSPGTGKSLIGQALAELLPKEKLQDILIVHNEQDDNNPLVKTMPRGQAKDLVNKLKIQSLSSAKNQNLLFFILLLASIFTPWWIRKEYGDIMAAASLIGSMIFLAAFVIFINISKRMQTSKFHIPKVLVDNSEKKAAPFFDASGANSGALLGDVLHDPLQSFVTSELQQLKENKKSTIKIKETINILLKKHKKELIKKGKYQATHLNKNELKVLAEKNKKAKEAEVLSVNKYKYNGNLIKLTTKSGKSVIVTPEHKVAVKNWLGKIIYKRADKIKPLNKLITIA